MHPYIHDKCRKVKAARRKEEESAIFFWDSQDAFWGSTNLNEEIWPLAQFVCGLKQAAGAVQCAVAVKNLIDP